MSPDIGDRVKLTKGPFRGEMGEVTGYDDEYFGEYLVTMDDDGAEIEVIPEDGLEVLA